MRALVVLAALLTLPAYGFTSERCKASFAVPKGWTAKTIARCKFGLKPWNWSPVEKREPHRDFTEYAIYIEIERKPFEEAARHGFFTREPEGWTIHGRGASRDLAKWMRNEHWFGVKGSTYVGYHRKGGGYEGLGSLWRAVLSNGKWRTATIEAPNPFSEKAFEQVVKSFRFLE